jgi:hypothetical protein
MPTAPAPASDYRFSLSLTPLACSLVVEQDMGKRLMRFTLKPGSRGMMNKFVGTWQVEEHPNDPGDCITHLDQVIPAPGWAAAAAVAVSQNLADCRSQPLRLRQGPNGCFVTYEAVLLERDYPVDPQAILLAAALVPVLRFVAWAFLACVCCMASSQHPWVLLACTCAHTPAVGRACRTLGWRCRGCLCWIGS